MGAAFGAPELIIIAIILSQVAALVIAGMKARWVWLALGVLLWVPAFIGALLPAKPDSHWARRKQRAGR